MQIEAPETPTPKLKRAKGKKRAWPKVVGGIVGVAAAAAIVAFGILPAAGIDVSGYLPQATEPEPAAGADDAYLAALQDDMESAQVTLRDGADIAADFQKSLARLQDDGDTDRYLADLDDFAAAVEDDLDDVKALRKSVAAAGEPTTAEGKSAKQASTVLLDRTEDALRDLQEMIGFEHDEVEEMVAMYSSVDGLDIDEDFDRYITTLFGAVESGQETLKGLNTPECLNELWVKYTDSLDSFMYSLAYMYIGREEGGSVLDFYSGAELLGWHTAADERYVTEINTVMDKQLAQSRKLLGTDLEQRRKEIASACAAGQEVPGESSTPKATIDYSMVSDIYPNTYPSADSVINLYACTDQPSQEILISAQVEGFTQRYEQKHTLTTKQSYLMIKPAALVDLPDLGESRATQLNLTVTDVESGKVLVQESKSVTLHSIYDFRVYNDEFGETAAYDLLGWLRPESAEVAAVNRLAVQYLEEEFDNGVLPGYQDGYGLASSMGEWGYDLTTLVQVAAIQKAISDAGVRYTMDAYSFDDTAQRVLTADQVVAQGTGICVESSVLMASCLMKAGLHSMIVLTPGHAQVAVESWEGSGEYYLIETTLIPYEGFSVDKDGSFVANGLIVTDVVTEQEWEEYLSDNEALAKRYGGLVFVIDCDLRSVLGISGLENA